MVGPRLKQLRLARGLALEGLAAEMGGIVTKQSLSKYEKGKAHPSRQVLTKLAAALQVKAAYLLSEPAVTVEILAYRRASRMPQKEQARVECLIQHRLEERVRLQSILAPEWGMVLPIQSRGVGTPEAAERVADEVRDSWNLGTDPIASVTGVLEDHCIHVLEVDASEEFDGMSAVAYDQGKQAVAGAVVARSGLPGERQRLSLVHEFAHLAGCDNEKTAFRFGAAFLAPASSFLRDVGAKRAFIQPEELLLLKKRFGMSVQATLYRLRDLEVIKETYYRQWCMDISRLGWRKQEPQQLPAERPTWLQQSVLRAVSEGAISKEEAEEMVGEELAMDRPLSLIQRRAFMKLPLEERRRLMAEQAEKLAVSYAEDPERRNLGGGDLVEY